MRQVTKATVSAFLADNEIVMDNTKVFHAGDYLHLSLFGNLIARKSKNGKLEVTSAGYKTNTTKERLNALPNVSINQKAGVWYLNGLEWNGKWTVINTDGTWQYRD